MTIDAEIGLLVIRASDMHRLAEFYSVIGMKFEKHFHPPCGEHYSTIAGNCVFEICQLKQGESPTTNVFFGLNVSDLDSAVNAVKANHGTVNRVPETSDWGRTAVIRDPEGHRVLLTQTSSASSN